MKQIPATTHAKCKEYHTTPDFCMCRDFRVNQGGSYVLHGIQVCKHVAHVVQDMYLVPNPDYDAFAAFNSDAERYSQWKRSMFTPNNTGVFKGVEIENEGFIEV